jgi:hypothetical protein
MFMSSYQKGMNTYFEKVSKAAYNLERTNKSDEMDGKWMCVCVCVYVLA